ncbi:MAG: hypothetical protein ACI9JU_002009, partial [Pseudohongiellaceae bacterium]
NRDLNQKEVHKMRSILDARFIGRPAGVEMALRLFQSPPRQSATPINVETTVFLLFPNWQFRRPLYRAPRRGGNRPKAISIYPLRSPSPDDISKPPYITSQKINLSPFIPFILY